MKIDVEKKEDVVIVKINGSLDVSLQSRMKDSLYEVVEGNDHDIVFDFSEISFIDSSCLGVMVALTKKVRELKGDIKLSHLSEDVRSIFQITRLDRVFEIFDDNQEAVDSFFR